MAPTTPYYNFGYPEETGTAAPDTAPLPLTVAPEASDAAARSRVRRQAAAATPKKVPQRGLGVAELERLRCGGDPMQDPNNAAAAAILEAAAAASLQAQQGHALFLLHQQQQQQRQQNRHDYLPSFDAATGSRYFSPLMAQPAPAPPAPARYLQGVVPQQQHFVDRWGPMGGFASAGNAAGGGAHQSLLQAPPAPPPENRSSQNTIWRPAFYSDESCHHSSKRCDVCTKAMIAMATNGARAKGKATATAAAVPAPAYSTFDLSAAMNAGRKETAGKGLMAPPEGRKEVREIEFFPTRSTSDGGGVVEPDESVLRRTPAGDVGGSAAPLDLSLKL